MRVLMIIAGAGLTLAGCGDGSTNNSGEASVQNLTVEDLTVNNVVIVDDLPAQASENTTVEPSPTTTESSRRVVENRSTRVAPPPPKQPPKPKPKPAPEPEPVPDPHAGHDMNNVNSMNRI